MGLLGADGLVRAGLERDVEVRGIAPHHDHARAARAQGLDDSKTWDQRPAGRGLVLLHAHSSTA